MKEAARKFLGRKNRINAKIKAAHPDFRVVVNKSNLFVRAQVLALDGKVVCSISDKGITGVTKTERAQKAGEALAELMKKASITKATFDRNGHLYHGRVKALAEWIRAWGVAI